MTGVAEEDDAEGRMDPRLERLAVHKPPLERRLYEAENLAQPAGVRLDGMRQRSGAGGAILHLPGVEVGEVSAHFVCTPLGCPRLNRAVVRVCEYDVVLLLSPLRASVS